MSPNEIKKAMQIPGKGNNETLEFINPLEHMTVATTAVQSHVPENRGTCGLHTWPGPE
jgi:hypothetical protein